MSQQFSVRHSRELTRQSRGLSIELRKLRSLSAAQQRRIHATHSFKRSGAGAYVTTQHAPDC
jgi:hypothetical protein